MERKLNRLAWIDFIKGIAVIEVVINHLLGIVNNSEYINLLTFFSVTVFILIAGYTSYLSMDKRGLTRYDYSYVCRRVKSIIVPYSVATLIYTIVFNKFLDVGMLIKNLLSFNTSPPFYYVLFFVQLIIVSPILFIVIKKFEDNKWMHIVIVIIVTIISVINIKFTFVLDVWGGGKYVLGGTYLLIFVLGMLMYEYKSKFTKNNRAISIISSIILLIITNKNIFMNFLGSYLNPPGIGLILYSIIMFTFLYGTYNLFLYKEKMESY